MHRCTGLSQYLTQQAVLDLGAYPLSALGSQGNPRQQTEMLASNSRAPCSKDASSPYLLCYCVLSLRLVLVLVLVWGIFWVPLTQVEVRANRYLSKGKLLGAEGVEGSEIYIII